MTADTEVTILSDGADGPRSLGEAASTGTVFHVLDCWGGRPHGIEVPELGCHKPRPEPSMSHITRIGIDTSKAVFTLHCVDDRWPSCAANQSPPRADGSLLKKLPAAEIAMEACGSSHHWARELSALGHTVRLIPPQYVKPFVKRAKNDRNDAEAICEAAGRPGMRFVPVKSAEQQAQGMVLKVRETLIGQRTQLANSLRGHAAEFGVIAGKGIKRIAPLLDAIEAETAIPAEAREMPPGDARPARRSMRQRLAGLHTRPPGRCALRRCGRTHPLAPLAWPDSACTPPDPAHPGSSRSEGGEKDRGGQIGDEADEGIGRAGDATFPASPI